DHDRSDRGHADAHPERQLGVPRHRRHAALQAQGARRRDPPAGGLHRRLVGGRRPRRRPGQAPVDRPEVRAEPGALDRRPAPRVQARAAGVRQVHRHAEGARRARRRDHLHVHRPADRPAGDQAQDGRGSPRLRLV
ncbi:MAG: SSU ribosomal protein S8p (S15Ae), partial [uncultured Corynebacteriales bacterium]